METVALQAWARANHLHSLSHGPLTLKAGHFRGSEADGGKLS
jgi:hypothetical protein